jgi:hypothetical protein
MRSDPGADFGGIAMATLIQPAVLVAARGCVGFGSSVTQQHQMAHGRQTRFVGTHLM